MTDLQRCPSCGHMVRAEARFCGGCGGRLAISDTTFAQGRPPQPGAPLAPGAAIGAAGRYIVERRLGQGGFGAAFLARDTRLDRPCVVKQLAFDPAWDAATRQATAQSFRREARLLVSLNSPGHPNIPEIYDYLDDERCLVMKYIAGRNLDQLLAQQGGRLTAEAALRYTRDVCAALAYMHGRAPEPVLHRDVKPANILLDESGRVWLIDFGLAKAQAAAAAPGELARQIAGSPATSQLAGTLGYTPPEQWRGQAEPRSDIYALGATLHRLITGYSPDRDELMALIRGEYAPPPIQRFVPELPATLDRLIQRSMAADPAARPDAAAMLAALDTLLTQPAVPAPPEPAHPPVYQRFVGRERELADLSERLERDNIVVISGLAGVGKTALAATLARRFSDLNKIFWHSFHEGEDAHVITWELAAFLAWHGQDELWRLLQSAAQTGGQPPPPSVLFDYVVQMLRGHNYLICLDDVQHVDHDPALEQFVRRLRGEARAGETLLLISARVVPGLSQQSQPLHGMGRADAQALLAAHGVELPADLAEQLYLSTEGNAQLLILAGERLAQGGDPARLIGRLASSESVASYLLQAVDDGLRPEERRLLQALAALLGYPGSRDALAALLDGGGLQRSLLDLSKRHLVTVQESEAGPAYSLHAMLREFYYEQLSRRERLALHQRAGAYYAEEEPNMLLAARHLALAGEHERAARLATANLWAIASAGQARPLRGLIGQLAGQTPEPLLQAELAVSGGELDSLLGDDGAAREQFGLALDRLSQERGPAGAALGARACLGMAATLEYDAPEQALEWLQRGLQRAEGAGLHIKTGTVLISLGRHEEALAALERGQALLPPGPSQLRVRALLTLGTIHSLRGDLARGRELSQQGVAICEQLGDNVRLGELLSNLAIDRISLGDWPAARADLTRARELAGRTGNRRLLLIVDANLGYLGLRTGELDEAWARLEEAAQLAREIAMPVAEISVLCTRADLQLRIEAPEAAAADLDQAEALVAQTGARAALPELLRLRARLALARGDAAGAARLGREALALAGEMGLDLDQGAAQAVVALALAAQGEHAAAQAQIGPALATLDRVDPYEAARARAAWADSLAGRDPAQADEMRAAARAAFARLGAAHELADAG